MKIFLSILRELGILIVIVLVLLAATFFAFKEQIPYAKEIPAGKEYTIADRKEYSVSSSNRLDDVEAVTITHETVSSQIVDAENAVRIQTGKNTPFGTISSESDLPTEKIGVSVSMSGDAANKGGSSNSGAKKEENLEFPVTDDIIHEIEEDQSESAESAADRRMDNEE